MDWHRDRAIVTSYIDSLTVREIASYMDWYRDRAIASYIDC